MVFRLTGDDTQIYLTKDNPPRSLGPATSDASAPGRRGRLPMVPPGAGARDPIRSCYAPLSCFRFAHDGSIMRGLFRSVSSHPGDSSNPGACPGFNHPTVCVPRETNGWQVDFLPVLKHRDSGIVVVPVVRVSLTVASSRRGEMESYTVSARV